MSDYQIDDLERLTGVKAHTIRMWERRYGLVTPSRTRTNRRSYSDDDVRKLLNVVTLLAQGHKISKIASLSEDVLNKQVVQAASSPEAEGMADGYINSMVEAMLAFDEPSFEKVLSAAITRLGMHGAVMQVIYPMLRRTGLLWSVNDAAPAHEHFASNIIRRKILAAIDGLMAPRAGAKTFLLFLPPGECHEIGLLFADYTLRAAGHRTIYLGQSLPLANVAKALPVFSPQFMVLFYVSSRPARLIFSELTTCAAMGSCRVLVAGSNVLLNETSVPATVTHLREVADLQGML